MIKQLATWALNFLATKAGAIAAVLLTAGISALAVWISKNIPFLYPYIDEPAEQLALAGVVMSAIMSFVNYITTARGFKYAEPVQRLLKALSDKLGLAPVLVDNVIAYQTAQAAADIQSKLTLPGGVLNPNADVKAATPAKRE